MHCKMAAMFETMFVQLTSITPAFIMFTTCSNSDKFSCDLPADKARIKHVTC